MTTGIAPCIDCKHFNMTEVNCTAFPDGIPLEIMSGENDHTDEVEGDNGIRYEPEE